MNGATRFNAWCRLALACVLTAWSACAAAQAPNAKGSEGVSSSAIKLGQTADLSGSRAANTKEFNAGALAYFDVINRGGGIFGRKIELVSLDDAYKVERSVANAKSLVEEHKVFAIFATVGTENFRAVEAYTTPAKVPFFAPSTGAEVLRAPYKRYVFPVRAGYHAETEKIIQHLTTIGITRIALVYDDDSFGKDILVGVERSLAKRSMKLANAGSFDREGKQIGAVAKKIAAGAPQAVIVGTAGKTALQFVKEMQALGTQTTYYMNSGVNIASLTGELKEAARGIAIVQLMPAVTDAGAVIALEYKKLAEGRPGTPLTPKGLEGYVSAKIFVEGVRRAGKDLNSEAFVRAMESMQNYDLGGIIANYSTTDHAGLTFVDLAVVSHSGKLLR